jgi:hypothetical protein
MKDLKPKTPEFNAMVEWLEDRRDKSLEEIAKNHGLEPAMFGELVKEAYTRCVHASVAYHSDKTGELSHGGAAEEQGVELWIYLYFQIKYGVYHNIGEEGLRHAQELEKDGLFDPKILTPKDEKYIKEHETKIKEALELYYSKFTGVGDGVTFNSACRRNGMNPGYAIMYMVNKGLGMPDTPEEARVFFKKLQNL